MKDIQPPVSGGVRIITRGHPVAMKD